MKLCAFDNVCPALAEGDSAFCPVHRWAFNHRREWDMAMKVAARQGRPACDECDGDGQIECMACDGNGETDACDCPNCFGHDCDTCSGEGHTKCEACEGTGIQGPAVEPIATNWGALELLALSESA